MEGKNSPWRMKFLSCCIVDMVGECNLSFPLFAVSLARYGGVFVRPGQKAGGAAVDCTCSGFPPKIGDRQRRRAASYALKKIAGERRTKVGRLLCAVPNTWSDDKGGETTTGWFRLRRMVGDDCGWRRGNRRRQEAGGVVEIATVRGFNRADRCRREQGRDSKAGRVEDQI